LIENQERAMNTLYGGAMVGRKNIAFGIALFLLLGVVVGIPLTINFFGGSVLSDEQYQTWKVVHGYGIFLGFINYFFGLLIDRLNLTMPQKELSSWCFLGAGAVGGLGRMALVLFSAYSDLGVFASLGEVVLVVVGTTIFVLGQIRTASLPSPSAQDLGPSPAAA
jgi:hypothetical protein